MRIWVTGHNARHGGGVSVAKNMIASLARVAPRHQYFFTIPPDLGFEETCQSLPNQECLVYRHRGLAQRWYWETFTLPKLAKAYRPDVILNLANRGFACPICPQATLILDAHLFYPSACFGRISWVDRLKFRYHKQHLRKSLRHTQMLFVETPLAERRLRETYGQGFLTRMCPNQFSVYASVPAEEVVEPIPLRPFHDKFKLFALSRYYPHKNLEVIPQLFRTGRPELRDVVVVMTIASDQHRNAARIVREIRSRGLEKNIILVGPLRHDELGAYYTHTNALFLPTLLECFSGSYLEAMHFERPILTSDLDFAHEICGDAALYFDPWNIESIAEAVIRLKNDKDLYQQLVKSGQERRHSHGCSWEDIAREVIAGLEELVERYTEDGVA